jgi:integrase/recombinase XerD
MTLPTPLNPTQSAPPSIMARLADIPEEEIWLAKQKSARTRRAYRLDVRHFMATLGITSSDKLRQIDHRAVIAWERAMREAENAAPSIIRRRLSALSSLFKHLVRHDHTAKNPVTEIERPDQPRASYATSLHFREIRAVKPSGLFQQNGRF